MKRIAVKQNANKLFNNNVHKVRNSKQRKALQGIKNDMVDYWLFSKEKQKHHEISRY